MHRGNASNFATDKNCLQEPWCTPKVTKVISETKVISDCLTDCLCMDTSRARACASCCATRKFGNKKRSFDRRDHGFALFVAMAGEAAATAARRKALEVNSETKVCAPACAA